MYGDTGVSEVDRVTGSIYSADPCVDRHHFISISSNHLLCLRLRGSSTPGSIISSHPNHTLLEPRTSPSHEFRLDVARGAADC